MYGERIGVLAVRLPIGTDVSDEDLTEIAATVARSIRLADTATDIYREVRRRKRLTIAAELQWDLLPGRTCESDEFALAGQLEPAYTVSGDNFDWSLSAKYLTLSGEQRDGKRHRRRAADPADRQRPAERPPLGRRTGRGGRTGQRDRLLPVRRTEHSLTLLLRIALSTAEAEVVDAGSPRMFRVRRGEIEPIKLDQQMPLGMFGDTRYRVQPVSFLAGDRLIILSDGLYGARGPSGRVYGQAPLTAALRSSRLQAPNETVRYLITDLLAHHEGTDLADDAIAVCLDWHGAGNHLVSAARTSLSDLPRPGGTSPDVMT